MDTVKGKQGVSKHVLLVLTERKTRKELLRKMPDGTARSVISEIDKLEKELGLEFRNVFKTITVDNGSEFADAKGLETSFFNPNEKKSSVILLSSISSYERGSNKNANKLVRRKIPKGINFDSASKETIKKYKRWINNYPRRLFGCKNAAWMFQHELEKIHLFGYVQCLL